MKILVVDDENISRRVLVSKMKILGECEAVGSARKALALLDKSGDEGVPYDIITLDVSMPDMDGKKVLQQIRKREIQSKIPKKDRVKVVMVSSRMNTSTIKACIKMGCSGYLVKPVSQYQLLETLGKLGVDTAGFMEKAEKDQGYHTHAVAAIISRFYQGKITLPTFPHIVKEVQALLEGESPSLDDLAGIIEKDIVISSKLVSIANSPLYKGLDRVDNLNGALVRLGMKKAQGLISAVAAKNLFDSENQSLKKQLDSLWIHSFAVASLGKKLGQVLDIENIETLFLMGILHDLGKMLLMKALVDIVPEIDIEDGDLQLALHEIHTTFGAALLKKMRFSPSFVQAAEFHHWESYGKDASPELMIVHLADRLAHEIGFGFLNIEKGIDQSGEKEKNPKEIRSERINRLAALVVLKQLGLEPEAVLKVGEEAGPMIRESARAF